MRVELCCRDDAAPGSEQAVGLNSAGEVVWAFSSPTGSDPIVHFAVEEDIVLLWSWEGYRYTVKKDDGTLLSTTFVK